MRHFMTYEFIQEFIIIIHVFLEYREIIPEIICTKVADGGREGGEEGFKLSNGPSPLQQHREDMPSQLRD